MIELNLMQYKDSLRVKKEGGKTLLFDALRRKWLVLQPEELVRQLVVQYLIQEKSYNVTRIKLEKGLAVNELSKRCDLLVFDAEIRPFLLIECKAPHVPIAPSTFQQVEIYNLPLRVPFLMVTNGIESYCYSVDYEQGKWEFLSEIPPYPQPGVL